MQLFNLAEANKTRESLGKHSLTLAQADMILRLMQGSAPVRDGAAFMQAIVNAPDPEE